MEYEQFYLEHERVVEAATTGMFVFAQKRFVEGMANVGIKR